MPISAPIFGGQFNLLSLRERYIPTRTVQCRTAQCANAQQSGSYTLGVEMASITVYLSDDNKALKEMLKELKSHDGDNNPYHGLSESRIAGRILGKFLPEEIRRVTNENNEQEAGK